LGGILRKEWGLEITQTAFTQSQLSLEIRAEALTFKEVIQLYEISRRLLS
jgi:hypothetical protein